MKKPLFLGRILSKMRIEVIEMIGAGMKKNQSHKKIFYAFLVACGLFSLTQSAPVQAYSFQDFKTAFQQTYPTLDTPLKDLKVLWNYGQKKLTFKPITKKESKAFWRAVKRTGIPLAVILSIITGLYVYKKRVYKKRASELENQQFLSRLDTFRRENKQHSSRLNAFHKVVHKEKLTEEDKAILFSASNDNTVLHNLVKGEDIELLKNIIKKAKKYLAPQRFSEYINNKNLRETPLTSVIFSWASYSEKNLKIIEILLKNGADPNIQTMGIRLPFDTLLDRYLKDPQRSDPHYSGHLDKLIPKNKSLIKLLLTYGEKPTEEPPQQVQHIYQEALKEVEEEKNIKRFRASLGQPVREGTAQEKEPEALQTLSLEEQYHIFEYVIGRQVRPLPTEETETEAEGKIEAPEKMEAPE